MKVKEIENHIIVTAGRGKYVGLKDRSVYGKELSLAAGLTKDDVTEEPVENWETETDGRD